MTCQDLHPLLAGYVDEQLSPEERRTVEEHVAQCSECRQLLEDQRAAAATYAQYAVDEASEAEWQLAWRKIAARLPAAAKRVSLESLSDFDDLGGEFLTEEELPAKRPAPRPATVPMPAQQSQPVRLADADRDAPLFKPVRIPRPRHMYWASVAGIAASVLIVFLVWLSVKPVIHTSQMASVGTVDLEIDVSDQNAPVVMMLQADDGENIPLIWIAQTPDSGNDADKEQDNDLPPT